MSENPEGLFQPGKLVSLPAGWKPPEAVSARHAPCVDYTEFRRKVRLKRWLAGKCRDLAAWLIVWAEKVDGRLYVVETGNTDIRVVGGGLFGVECKSPENGWWNPARCTSYSPPTGDGYCEPAGDKSSFV